MEETSEKNILKSQALLEVSFISFYHLFLETFIHFQYALLFSCFSLWNVFINSIFYLLWKKKKKQSFIFWPVLFIYNYFKSTQSFFFCLYLRNETLLICLQLKKHISNFFLYIAVHSWEKRLSKRAWTIEGIEGSHRQEI